MSRPRFLADHDLNEQIVTGVLPREPALACVRARDVGMSEHLDAEVLAYAADNGFIVVSHDVNTTPSAAYARIEYQVIVSHEDWTHKETGLGDPVMA
jgi:predicted nuclease of predicted toxin-antitoxin system